MKIWYDVSGLYNWAGPFTGIQRVVYNLGKELHEIDSGVHYFAFRGGNFVGVGFEELEARVAERIAYSPTDKARAAVPKSKRALLQHHGMVLAKQMVIGSRLEQPLRRTYRGARASYRNMRPRQETAPMERTIFGSDDVVVVVDGNWQFPAYDQRLIAAKKLSGFKLVHMVHDMVAVKNPAFANAGAKKIIGTYFKNVFAAADMLVAVSESTKRDVEWFIHEYDISTKAVLEVIQLGVSLSAKGSTRRKKPDAALPAEYILSVSTIEVRKNYMELYYAYKLAHQKGVKLPHLVIVGRKGWRAEEVFALLTEDTDINQHITVLQGPPDEELAWLYENCLFMVTPAFYEGWGLTIAEAFAFGKACISSNTSSLPEVGKDMALYVSPYNPSEAMDAILDYTNPEARKRAEARIAEEYSVWTWKDSARSVIKLIQ